MCEDISNKEGIRNRDMEIDNSRNVSSEYTSVMILHNGHGSREVLPSIKRCETATGRVQEELNRHD